MAFVLSVLVALGGGGYLLTNPGRATTRSAALLGVIGASGQHLAVEKASGVRSITIIMGWDNAEPVRGATSASYLASVNRRIRTADDDGFAVVVDPGLQYPPTWVFGLGGGTRFVDQYDDTFTGARASGDDIANGITDPTVRAAMASYLALLGRHLLLRDVATLRQGGGPLDELSYPGSTYDGHHNCYWAYDTSTRALSPAFSYVPGTSTPARARAFLDRYNGDLISFADAMRSDYGRDFDRPVDLLLPGWGQRPGVAAAEVSSLLEIPYGEFNEGLDWVDLLPALPDRADTVAYTTYLDAPSFAANPRQEDPAAFIASLAGPLHMRLGGENTGVQTPAALRVTLRRARQLDMASVNWFGERQLVASTDDPRGGSVTFATLAKAAKATL